jgi:hypothetical protein
MALIWAVEEEQRRKVRRAYLFGALLGLAVGGTGVYLLTRPAEAVVDPGMERGCKLPKLEGESTNFIVVDGKLRCYRYY